MGMTISGGGAYILQMQQQSTRHNELNSALFDHRKATQDNVVNSIQKDSLKQSETMASIKQEAVHLGNIINTFA